jgi:hypothetical protein
LHLDCDEVAALRQVGSQVVALVGRQQCTAYQQAGANSFYFREGSGVV